MNHIDLADAVAVDVAYPPMNDSGGVRLVRDGNTGAIAIVLDADAADALDAFFDGLGLAHDLIADGYDMNGVDVITTIRGLLRA